jgi:hypothetical protein
MNVVDSVSKVSHFIPTHTTITALDEACLSLVHVWKLHGLPKQILMIMMNECNEAVGHAKAELR